MREASEEETKLLKEVKVKAVEGDRIFCEKVESYWRLILLLKMIFGGFHKENGEMIWRIPERNGELQSVHSGRKIGQQVHLGDG